MTTTPNHQHPNHPASMHIVAVVAMIFNAENQLLMIHSPDRGWELPGGKVEVGENLFQALRREVMEETGVQAEIEKLVGIYSRPDDPSILLLSFKGYYTSGTFQTEENILAIEWVDLNSASERISHPAIADAVKDLLKNSDWIIYRSYSMDPYRVLAEYEC